MAAYHELIIKGHEHDLVPYLAGAGLAGVYFAQESGLHVKELRELLRHHGDVQHIVCRDEVLGALKNALAQAAPRFVFEIKEERAVTRATFSVEVDTPSRDVAATYRAALDAPPPRVRVDNATLREEIDPSARGTEIYSPTHEYRFEASADVGGDVAGVILMRKTLSAIDFVKCDEIELHDA